MKELLLVALLLTQGIPQQGTQTGTVSGRLLSPDGMPAAGVRVTAVPAQQSNIPGSGVEIVSIVRTDASGRYRLENIPPGRYFISAGPLDFPTYYPGVYDPAGGTALTITTGPVIDGMDFTLGSARAFKVSGRVIRDTPTATETGSQSPLARHE